MSIDTMYVHVYACNILLPFAPVIMVYMYLYMYVHVRVHVHTCTSTWIWAQPAELLTFLCSW